MTRFSSTAERRSQERAVALCVFAKQEYQYLILYLKKTHVTLSRCMFTLSAEVGQRSSFKHFTVIILSCW